MTRSIDPIVIGVGGNVGGEPAILERFRRARAAFAELGDVRSAPLYRTAFTGPSQPPGGPAQPPFLNSALRVRIPDVQPGELIATVLEIEALLGRDRRGVPRFGPRLIDLDVLVWGERVIRTPELELPHPRLFERRFALEPLVALLGEDFEIAGHGPAGVLLERVRDQASELISETW